MKFSKINNCTDCIHLRRRRENTAVCNHPDCAGMLIPNLEKIPVCCLLEDYPPRVEMLPCVHESQGINTHIKLEALLTEKAFQLLADRMMALVEPDEEDLGRQRMKEGLPDGLQAKFGPLIFGSSKHFAEQLTQPGHIREFTESLLTVKEAAAIEKRKNATPCHELKIWPIYFASLAMGAKTFDVRLNDRDFQVGDVIKFREWEPVTQKYSGQLLTKQVVYIQSGGPGIKKDTVILGIAPCFSSDPIPPGDE